jgi:copper homeostasis protein (lipoprotein)
MFALTVAPGCASTATEKGPDASGIAAEDQEGAAASDTRVIRGTAIYRERIALPPDAVLEVALEDVSRADALAQEIGSVRVENPGNPPFNFEIAYDPALIEERQTYAVRAAIRVGDKLMFTTDTVYPVLTRGADDQVELMLKGVPGAPNTSGAAALKGLPARFEGELPCADCPGIHYRLDLHEDRVFFLRTTYLGRGADAVRDLIGTWALSSDDNRIALFGGTEAPIFFRILDAGTIRKLDIEGRDIESSLDYNLRRKDDLEPIEPRLTMRGMYRYMADAALFEECLSGRRFPVYPEADNVALERAYMGAQREPGEPLLVSLQGSLALRPAMEGDAMVLSLVPERFIGVWPGETCGARMANAELEDTYWKLTRLGDEPVIVGERHREPHLVLRSEDRRVSGFGGCNRLMGGYAVDGSSIRFSQMASTMMACAEGADTERLFTEALERVRSWRLIGHHLDFFDEAGELVGRFEARLMD